MKVAVVGGGITGLAVAQAALKKGHDVELFEASGRLGGWIETKEVDGFCFELGPRTFQTRRCPMLLQLMVEFGLEVVESDVGTRYLWHQGKLRAMGSFWPQLIVAGVKDFFTPKRVVEDETIYEFAVRRCGKKAAELFFDPMAKGVFAGDIRKLSVRSCFPFLHQSSSIVKAMKGQGGTLFTVKGGLQKLVDAMSPKKVNLNCKIEELPEADLVVVTVPLFMPVRYESLSVVNLGYWGDVLPKKGFGYLVPSMEGERLLGQIWDTSVFPVAGQTKVTSMVRGEKAVEIAIEAMERHLGVKRRPDAVHVKEAMIPQYDVNHHVRVAKMEEAVKKKFGGRVKLAGNYLRGASVEACIRSGFGVFS